MNRYRATDPVPAPCTTDEAAAIGWTRWVREKWGAVRVTHLKTVPLHPNAPGRVRARANVHLGGLAPADVLVEATPGGTETIGASDEWPVRLCSTQSYGNGTYVFEGLLPSPLGEKQRRVAVRVRPGTAHEALATLREVVRSFELRFGHAADRHRPVFVRDLA